MRLFQWLRGRQQQTIKEAPESRIMTLSERSYLEDAPYMLPKDEREIDRLDLQHYVLRYQVKGNYVAPLQKPGRILDIGCGTGRWAIEMAQTFPAAEIVGLDVVKPMVDAAQRPQNVLFLQRDILKGLPFTDQIFDYVHMRFLVAALPQADFQGVVNELVRVLRPGGWIELAEPGVPGQTDIGMSTLWEWIVAMGLRRGIQPNTSSQIAGFLEKAGLVNISARTVELPFGAYAGRLGEMSAQNMFALVEGLQGPVVAQKLATDTQYRHMLERARIENTNPRGTSVSPIYFAIGQRSG